MIEGQNQNQGAVRTTARNPTQLGNRVLLLEFMEQKRWDTSSTTATKTVISSTLQNVAGKIESMQAGFFVTDPGPNFRCDLRVETSWNETHWVDVGSLFSAWQSAAPQRGQYCIDPLFTNTQAMGRHIRFVFCYSSSQAASAHAVLSGGVTIKFVGQ